MKNPLKLIGVAVCLPVFGVLCLTWVLLATPFVWVLEKCDQPVAGFPYIF
jgi:hypothetical protein